MTVKELLEVVVEEKLRSHQYYDLLPKAQRLPCGRYIPGTGICDLPGRPNYEHTIEEIALFMSVYPLLYCKCEQCKEVFNDEEKRKELMPFTLEENEAQDLGNKITRIRATQLMEESVLIDFHSLSPEEQEINIRFTIKMLKVVWLLKYYTSNGWLTLDQMVGMIPPGALRAPWETPGTFPFLPAITSQKTMTVENPIFKFKPPPPPPRIVAKRTPLGERVDFGNSEPKRPNIRHSPMNEDPYIEDITDEEDVE